MITARQQSERSAFYDGMWDIRNKVLEFDYALKSQANNDSRATDVFRKLHLVWHTLKVANSGSVSGKQLQELGPNLPFQLVPGLDKRQRSDVTDVNLVAVLGPDVATAGPFETIVLGEDMNPILATLHTAEAGAKGLVVPRRTTDYSFLSNSVEL